MLSCVPIPSIIIEKGGHAYDSLIQLIDELKSLKKSKALGEKED
jgi:hypothetical protein